MLKARSRKRLKHLIRISGYNSKEFAVKIQITPAYLSSVIYGRYSPSPKLAKRIVDELNSSLGTEYDINTIFFDTGVPKLQQNA